MESLHGLAVEILKADVIPVVTYRFGHIIARIIGRFARFVIAWCYHPLETEDVQAVPGSITHRDHPYLRMRDKTIHNHILTLFGHINSSPTVEVLYANVA